MGQGGTILRTTTGGEKALDRQKSVVLQREARPPALVRLPDRYAINANKTIRLNYQHS